MTPKPHPLLLFRGVVFWSLVSTFVFVETRVKAEIRLWDRQGLQADFSLTAAAGYFHVVDANFGAGRLDDRVKNLDWFEGYLKPQLMASFATDRSGLFYGGASVVGSIAAGDGDAGGFASPNATALSSEQLFLGWRSGALLEALGTDALDVSAGRQDFQIGDGFLIWDGNYERGREGTYRLLARRSFRRTALLRLNIPPVRGSFFYLQADTDNGHPEILGVDAEYVHGKSDVLGFAYFTIIDADKGFKFRDGLEVVNIRAQGNPLETIGVQHLALASEYVHEENSRTGRALVATAWYVKASYSFVAFPWSPVFSYRFAFFSGDDPRTGKNEEFDPLFYSYSRGWDTWTQGEIVGSYLLFNSNQRTHLVHLQMQPARVLSLGVLYWRFLLDQPATFTSALHCPTAEDFVTEIDFYADWQISESLSLSSVFGLALPERGARQAFGARQDYKLLEMYLTMTL
jgi:hypothetical protein